MSICPACNGLLQLEITCPFCHKPMSDQGSLADYYGPYSPYMDEQSFELASLWSPAELTNPVATDEDLEPCIHLVACSNCRWDTRIAVNQFPSQAGD